MMFKFRLQRILELRQQAEQARARELVSARDDADVAREAQKTIEELHTTSRAQTNAAQRRPPTMRYHIEGCASSLRRTFAGLPSYDTKWKSRPRMARCR